MREGLIARQRYSSLIPSQARETTPTTAESEVRDIFENRRSRMTRIPQDLPIPEIDMLCPPSLTSGASTVSGFYSPQHVLGTPQFHPETYQSQQSCTDPLDIRVEVVLEPNGGDRLEMYGTSKTGTSYSLPGHIVLTVPNLVSSLEAHGRIRIVKELKVVFEGKTEFCDDAGRYKVMRLVKHEASLLTPQGFELHAPQDSAGQPNSKDTTYAIPFDLKIPGWLPQSFENDTVALSYGLVATAKVEWITLAPSKSLADSSPHLMDVDNAAPVSSSPVPIMSAAPPTYASRFFPRLKSVANALATAITLPSPSSSQQVTRASDWQSIIINRHRVPAPPCAVPSVIGVDAAVAETPLRHYTLRPAENSPSPVECVVSVPETIDINGPTLRVSVRLRARDGFTVAGIEGAESAEPSTLSAVPESGSGVAAVGGSGSRGSPTTANAAVSSGNVPCPKQSTLEHIRMVELGMEVEETERYSSTPAQTFMSAYPIPEDQPDECSPHHGSSALLSPPSRLSSMSMFGLTSSKGFKGTRTRTLLLGEDGKSRAYRFDGEGLELGVGWRKVNIIIPMPSETAGPTSPDDINRKPAAEIDTPFLRIKHKLKIRIVCRSRAMPGQDTIVVLTTPLRCGTAPQPRSFEPLPLREGSLQPMPSGPSQVPAYCQIYHENGTAREDEEALPLYAPDSPPAYASSFPHAIFSDQASASSSSLGAVSPVLPAELLTETARPGAFGEFEASTALQGVDVDDQSLPSVPTPRGCRSVSSLSSISEGDRSIDEHDESSVSGSLLSSPQLGSSSVVPSFQDDRHLTQLENRLIDIDRTSSEAILPEYLDAAQQRAISRAKHYRPTPSRLSGSINNT